MDLDLTKISMMVAFGNQLQETITDKLKTEYPESKFDEIVLDGYLIRPTYEDYLEQKFEEELGSFTKWLVDEYYVNRRLV